MEGDSRSTEYSGQQRGTPCYRAPELISGNPRFTNKVDIWALGCILFKITTGNAPFQGDWNVIEYAQRNDKLPISVEGLPEFENNLLYDLVNELLSREWRLRPRAPVVQGILFCYSQLFKQPMLSKDHRPSCEQIKAIAIQTTIESELLERLQNICDTVPLSATDANVSSKGMVLENYSAQEANEIDLLEGQIISNIEFINGVPLSRIPLLILATVGW